VWTEPLIAEFEPLLMVANARIDRIVHELDVVTDVEVAS
jgi:hypothetical protein